MSIHADSLHPSVRGLMVYVPVATCGRRAPSPAGIWPCEERDLKAPRFPAASTPGPRRCRPSSARRSCRRPGGSVVAVHPYQPVRSSVLRGGSRWVPAVLRYSRVPTSVLVEICNLTNEEDRGTAADGRLPREARPRPRGRAGGGVLAMRSPVAYAGLALAVLAISWGAPLARLTVAAPLAVAMWRMVLATALLLPLALVRGSLRLARLTARAALLAGACAWPCTSAPGSRRCG